MELLKELSNEPADYRNYLRMTEDTYQELLCLVSPLIERQSTVMRNPISPHERLSATLRFLATPDFRELFILFCSLLYTVLNELIFLTTVDLSAFGSIS